MTYFSGLDINNLQHIYKINLINSCSGYKSANLIATKSANGIENIAVFSSVTHLGSCPPLISFILRPTTVIRDTYENIKTTGYYTINHIQQKDIEDAHHTSAKYNSSTSEFDVTKLESEYKNPFFAPFVKDAPVKLAMKYVEEYHIKANDTILVVGEIVGLYVENKLIQEDGFIDLAKGNIATINGLDGYAVPKKNKRYGYQRPKEK